MGAMDVNETTAVSPLSPSTSGGDRREPEQRRGGGQEREDRRWPDADTVSVMGIPDHMLTPEVRSALDSLVAESERLRQALAWSRERQAKLEKAANRHIFLPVLNRHAFLHELGNLLTHGSQLPIPGSVLGLHLTNGEHIRRRLGRRALDGALRHVCQVLTDALHPTDVVANVGGNDFAVILLVADQVNADQKALALVKVVHAHPFRWADEDIVPEIAVAARELTPGAEPDAIMDALDRDLMAAIPTPDGRHREDTGAGDGRVVR